MGFTHTKVVAGLALLLALCSACSAAGRPNPTALETLPPARISLPGPAQLVSIRAAANTSLLKGADIDAGIAAPQHVSILGTAAEYSPQPGTLEQAPQAAWAAYSIDAQDISYALLTASWESATPGDKMHLGWANFLTGRWDWMSREPGDAVKVDVLAPYVSPLNTVVLVIAVEGPGPARLSSLSLKSLLPGHWDLAIADPRGAGTTDVQALDPVLGVCQGKPAILYDWQSSVTDVSGVYCAWAESADGSASEDWYHSLVAEIEPQLAKKSFAGGRPTVTWIHHDSIGSARSRVLYCSAGGPAGPWGTIELLTENGIGIDYDYITEAGLVLERPAVLIGSVGDNFNYTIYGLARDADGQGVWDLRYTDEFHSSATAPIEVQGKPAWVQRVAAGNHSSLFWRLGASALPSESEWLKLHIADYDYFSRAPALHRIDGQGFILISSDSGLDIWQSALGVGGAEPWVLTSGASVEALSYKYWGQHSVSLTGIGGKVTLAATSNGFPLGEESPFRLRLAMCSSQLHEPEAWTQHLLERYEPPMLGAGSDMEPVSICEIQGRPAVAYPLQEYDAEGNRLSLKLCYAIYSESSF